MITFSHKETKKKSGIYIITNVVNNKVYIGRTSNLYDRILQHKTALIKNLHYNSYLQSSYNKYKDENFKCEILEFCEILELPKKEEHYINLYDSSNKEKGYNLDSYLAGVLIVNEQTKLKISKSSKGRIPVNALKKLKELRALGLDPGIGRIVSEKVRIKMSNASKGRVPTKALLKIKELSEKGIHPNIGKKHKFEDIEKQKLSYKNRTKEQKLNTFLLKSENMKKRICNYQEKKCSILDLNNNVLKSYCSVKDLCLDNKNYNPVIIRRICTGLRKNKVYMECTYKYD